MTATVNPVVKQPREQEAVATADEHHRTRPNALDDGMDAVQKPAAESHCDANGEEIWIPGTLKGCKAIGWYIDEYGIAQVSMNITDITATPLHVAFEEVSRAAAARGMRVTGAEIVGLVPKCALIDAGKYYLARQQRSLGITEEEIIRMAVKSMGLDELKPFNPKEKVIEYMIVDEKEQAEKEHLIRMTCKGIAIETASESAAPGGGSISAYMGALGAALGTMVANLSAHKRGWDERWEEFSKVAEEGQEVMNELLALVDEDTAAFNKIMDVFAMPKGTEEEKKARAEAMEAATLYATQVPLRTMKASMRAFPVIKAMAEKGNPASASDAGVGALAARAAVRGADMNVRINAAGLKNRETAERLIAEAAAMVKEAEQREADVPFRHGNIKNQAEYHDQYSGNTVDLDISLLDHADYDPCPGVPKAATKSLSGMLNIRVFVPG